MDAKKTFDYLKKHYVNNTQIDWTQLARLQQFVPEGHKIRFMIAFLNDPHTKIMHDEIGGGNENGFPTITHSKSSITLKYYSFMGTDVQNYVKSVHSLQGHISKIIIDLRDNGGGYGYPMILSMAAILPFDRPIGYFAINGKLQPIIIKTEATQIKLFNLRVPRPARVTADEIIVRIGPGTASSGEWMAICLRCLNNVKFIGNTTGAFNSVNAVINTVEGRCQVTIGYYADVKKKIWKGPLRAAELNMVKY